MLRTQDEHVGGEEVGGLGVQEMDLIWKMRGSILTHVNLTIICCEIRSSVLSVSKHSSGIFNTHLLGILSCHWSRDGTCYFHVVADQY